MDRTDRLLIVLAVVYMAIIATGLAGAGLHSSADRVGHGDVWLLATSALTVVPTLAVAQWILLAAAIGVVIWRHGPKLWWTVAIIGHIGAAVVSYLVIGLAVLIGSGSADTAAGQADYGISIVLAATVGAMTAGALAVPPERRSRGDKALIGLGLIGLTGMIAFSIGWYDMQHVIGYGIGFLLAGLLLRRSVFRWAPPGSGRPAG